jgi:hypothetical protein
MSQQPTIVDSLKALPVMVPWFWAILGQVSPMDSKNRQKLDSWFLQKKWFQVVFSGSPKTNQLEVKEIKF